MIEFSMFVLIAFFGAVAQSVWVMRINSVRARNHLQRKVLFASGVSLIVGIIGFFSGPLYVAGLSKIAPPNFEWPVGYTKQAIVLSDSVIVGLQAPGRVQIYSSGLEFKHGWTINAMGGAFSIKPAGNLLLIQTARGNKEFQYTLSGELLSTSSYAGPFRENKKGSIGAIFTSGIYKIPFFNAWVGFILFVVGAGVQWANYYLSKNLTRRST